MEGRTMSWASEELKTVNLGDARLNRRLMTAVEQLAEHPAQSVPQACGSAGAAKAVYRLWDNERVSDEEIRKAHVQATCSRGLEQPVVLAIQDTTDLDFTRHPATQGLGYLERSYLRGIQVHSTLAARESGVPQGLLHQKVWVRDEAERGKKHTRHTQATRDKESQRGLDAWAATQAALPGVPCLVTVADREADIFDFLAAPRSDTSHLRIRAAQNRRVDGEVGPLFDRLAQAPAVGIETVGSARSKREAVVTLRHTPASIRPPKNGPLSGTAPVAVHAVLAEEETPPAGAEAIRWRLLTTLPLAGEADVRRCLRMYSGRWLIERYHFTLKSGCGVERLQRETADRLERALATYGVVAWRLLGLTYQAREDDSVPCTVALQEHEGQSLYCKTHHSLTLPEHPPTLRQAVRWMAQLGGFLGRKGDGEPGVKVLWRGFQRLTDIADDGQLFHPQPPDYDHALVGNG
jgi:hypothetical protein